MLLLAVVSGKSRLFTSRFRPVVASTRPPAQSHEPGKHALRTGERPIEVYQGILTKPVAKSFVVKNLSFFLRAGQRNFFCIRKSQRVRLMTFARFSRVGIAQRPIIGMAATSPIGADLKWAASFSLHRACHLPPPDLIGD